MRSGDLRSPGAASTSAWFGAGTLGPGCDPEAAVPIQLPFCQPRPRSFARDSEDQAIQAAWREELARSTSTSIFNWVELWLMRVIGTLAGCWQPLDRAMYLLLRNDLLKGVPFAAALLVLWAVPQAPHQEAERVSALRLALAAIISLLVGRILQNSIASPRPLMIPDIAAMYPAAFEGYQFDWNSFPSDHMALYFAIALGSLGRRRLLGLALLIWSLAGVAFPRLYVEYHYPLDILGGMAVATASLAMLWWARGWLSGLLRKVDHLATRHPAVATAGMFCLCFQIATVFDSVRELGTFGRDG